MNGQMLAEHEETDGTNDEESGKADTESWHCEDTNGIHHGWLGSLEVFSTGCNNRRLWCAQEKNNLQTESHQELALRLLWVKC